MPIVSSCRSGWPLLRDLHAPDRGACGLRLARRPGWISRILEEFISLPLAIPGLALALALLQLYGSMKGFRTSWTFILVGHVLYTLPFMVRSVLAVLSVIDLKTLEEGAASLGASPWRRFWDIVVPNAMPGILAGALTVVTLSIGEFNLTWMLHTPYLKTLPVGSRIVTPRCVSRWPPPIRSSSSLSSFRF